MKQFQDRITKTFAAFFAPFLVIPTALAQTGMSGMTEIRQGADNINGVIGVFIVLAIAIAVIGGALFFISRAKSHHER